MNAANVSEPGRVLVVGCSDGIGLATVRGLLARGWRVTGVSRRRGPVEHPAYHHEVIDVAEPGYQAWLAAIVRVHGPFDAGLYCAGIGGHASLGDLSNDLRVFQVNLMAAIETAAALLPDMIEKRRGRFAVLSSQADQLVLPDHPSYAASKAALSAYFEALGLETRKAGVRITNIRFGFVDTKMARAPVRPFLRSTDWAADVVVRALAGRAIRVSRPRRLVPLVSLLRWLTRWRVWLA